MGNDSSHLNGLVVNEKAVEITDFWAHYHATVKDTGYFFNLKGFGSISVFKTESPVLGNLWKNQSPLEKYSMNLMKYRHPCILRYVWHWQQRGVHYLTTECVQPLSQVLPEQDMVQICIGLNQIAQALDFLHNNASLSHNNIGIGSIYVLHDGTWKLGDMELAKPFKEMTANYLNQAKKYRYDRAIDSNEENVDDFQKIDQFAFAQLVEDVFKGRNTDDLPHWQDFKVYCQKELKNLVVSQRPNFSMILKHDFFNHEFISIHKFFVSLPVKTEKEKSEFFSVLLDKLKKFDEEIVARQLSGPLLSRLVLLDSTARDKLLPYVLAPKQEDDSSSDTSLFSERIFKTYVTPHLLKMFRVRDIQVRLLLLKYFSGFFSTFSKEDLTAYVLPELLLGIKDTSDALVSMTLYCLADLVPVLGASAVIGGKRSKLFADGRPLSHNRIKSENVSQRVKQKRPVILEKIEEDIADTEKSLRVDNGIDLEKLTQNNEMIESSELNFGSRDSVVMEHSLFLHERPSPDGGEDLDCEVVSKTKVINAENGDENDWSDWDTDERPVNESSLETDLNISNLLIDNDTNAGSKDDPSKSDTNESTKTATNRFYLQKAALDAKAKKLTDISELDIKNQKFTSKPNSSTSNKDQFDFFLDMEPVIEKPNVFTIEQNDVNSFAGINAESNKAISSKLSFVPVETDDSKDENNGWGDTDWDD